MVGTLPIATGVPHGGAAWISLGSLLHLFLAFLCTLHTLRRRREASSALLWILLVWAFPGIGVVLYAMIGMDRIPAKAFKKRASNERFQSRSPRREFPPCRAPEESPPAVSFDSGSRLLRELNQAMDTILPESPGLSGNDVRLLLCGDKAFPAMLETIARARHHVHLSTFIIGNDRTGRTFLDLLARKAEEGVTVRFLYDRFGSTHAWASGFLWPYQHKSPRLRLAGWTQANPLKRQFQLNLRNHRKILVVDGETAFVGGINLHDEHATRGGLPPIRDYQFQITGPAVSILQYTFLRDWFFMTGEDPDDLLVPAHFPSLSPAGDALVRVVNSGPSSRFEKIAEVYFNAIILARRTLQVVTPYFVPTADLIRALRSAAMRHVDVRLLVPRENNHVYAGLAGRAHYDELLSAGVRIFERQPPFMHAKAMLVDDELAIVGTANLDARSLRLNYETNLVLAGSSALDPLRAAVSEDFAHATEILPEEWCRRPVRQRMLENFCALLSPIL